MDKQGQTPKLRTERDFARAAGTHLMSAQQRVLASGDTVLFSRDGVIYRRYPDGREEVVRTIAPPMVSKRGRKYRLR